MAEIFTIGGRHLDVEQFFAQTLATARANLSYVQGSERAAALRQVAREALQEAHSTLSQSAFFACLDALGGQEAVVERLVTMLRLPAPACAEAIKAFQDEVARR